MLLILPAIIAFFAKLVMLAAAPKRDALLPWRWYLLAMLLLNICEVTLLAQGYAQIDAGFVLRLYFITCTLVLAYGLWFCVHRLARPIKIAALFLIALGLPLVALIAGSDLVVYGHYFKGYYIYSEKGVLFKLFLLYSLIAFASQIVFLIVGRRSAQNVKDKVYYDYNLLAVGVALSVPAILAIAWMAGHQISSLALFPLATTFFLFVSAKGVDTESIGFDFRFFVPKTPEQKAASEISYSVAQYIAENKSHKAAMAEIERALFKYKLDQNGGNISRTASSLSVSRSTLYSMKERMIDD